MLSGGINAHATCAAILDQGAQIEQGIEDLFALISVKDIVSHNDEAVCIPCKSFRRASKNVIRQAGGLLHLFCCLGG